ncbi:MAG: hypothetical protein LCH30_10680 [Proteobacteria bacterium]|nr:hypothetical protein [Pseudomonadota bacterium]
MYYLIKTDNKLKILVIYSRNIPDNTNIYVIQPKDIYSNSNTTGPIKLNEVSIDYLYLLNLLNKGQEKDGQEVEHEEPSEKINLNYCLFDLHEEQSSDYLPSMSLANYKIDERLIEQISPDSVVLAENLDKKNLANLLKILTSYKGAALSEKEEIISYYRPLKFDKTLIAKKLEARLSESRLNRTILDKSGIKIWMAFDIVFHLLGLGMFIDYKEDMKPRIGPFKPFFIYHLAYHNKPYYLNMRNFWAIFWNIPIRLLGNVLGLAISLLISIFILPLLFVIGKLYCAIQEIRLVRNIIQEYGSIEPLLDCWFNMTNYEDVQSILNFSPILARNINSYDFMNSTLSFLNRFKPYTDSYYSAESKSEKKLSELYDRKIKLYLSERQEYIYRDLTINFILTVCLAILFLPSLIFTYFWHKNKEKEHTDELYFLSELKNLPSLGSHTNIYPAAETLKDQKKTGYAALFFSHTRPDDNNYKNAMAECAHYERAEGHYETAKFFASRADDQPLLDSIEKIAPVVKH